jgi:hypothetical protein
MAGDNNMKPMIKARSSRTPAGHPCFSSMIQTASWTFSLMDMAHSPCRSGGFHFRTNEVKDRFYPGLAKRLPIWNPRIKKNVTINIE